MSRDEPFNIALAAGVQTDFDTENATIAALSGSSLDSSDGMVRGIRDAGDGESGITIPDLERLFSEKAISGLTQNFSTYLRTAVNGLAIAFEVKGSGGTVSGTPGAGESAPLAGIDAILEGAGLTGVNGTAPTVDYEPVASPTYLTIKLWVADHSYVFKSCLVSSLTTVYTPGEVGIRTATFAVGALTAQNDGVTFPDPIDYTTQDSLAAPVITGITHDWGVDTAGFTDLEIAIENSIAEVPDSAVPDSGMRVVMTEARQITASVGVYLDTTDTDFEYEELIKTAANTEVFAFQLGTVADGSGPPLDAANGVLISMNNPETRSVKYGTDGINTTAEIELVAVDGTAGQEYTETYN